MSANNVEKKPKDISCLNLFDRLMYCGKSNVFFIPIYFYRRSDQDLLIINTLWIQLGTPLSQFDYIYKNGEPESCSGYLYDLTKCLHAKLIFDEVRKQVRLHIIIRK